MKIINKEELYNYLFLGPHTIDEAAKYFGVDYVTLNSYMAVYGLSKRIKRPPILDLVSKEELYQFYIVEDHKLKEVYKKFNINNDILRVLLAIYGINKIKLPETLNDLLKRISKEDLYTYYVIKNNSIENACKHFNLSGSSLFKLLHHYNIFKKNPRIDINILSNKISKDELNSYLNIEKHSKEEACKHFKILRKDLRNLLDYYGLKMDKQHEPFSSLINRISKEDLENYFIKEDHSFNELISKFNLAPDAANKLLKYYDIPFNYKNGTSWYEEDIINNLPKGIKIEKKNRKVLGNGQEIDIYLPDYKFGIEFNVQYWHSSLQKPNTYHFEKSKLAEEKGITLIHIYQWEWDDKIKREDIIQYVNSFLIDKDICSSNYNIEKTINKGTILYKICYGGVINQVLTFNLKNNSTWELSIKYPSLLFGVKEVFDQFIKDYSPNGIIGKCNFDISNGKEYKYLGMRFNKYLKSKLYYLSSRGQAEPLDSGIAKDKILAEIWGAGIKEYIWQVTEIALPDDLI